MSRHNKYSNYPSRPFDSQAGIFEHADHHGRVFETEKCDQGNVLRHEEIGPYYTRFDEKKGTFVKDFELGLKLQREQNARTKKLVKSGRILCQWRKLEKPANEPDLGSPAWEAGGY